MRNFYSLFNCDESTTDDQLKQAYFQQLRQVHPDKSGVSEYERFLDLNRAWKVLRDSKARAEYNNWLREQQFRAEKELIFGEVWLDTQEAGDTTEFEEICRCGGLFQVSRQLIEQIVLDCILVDCSNCSLTLRVWRTSPEKSE